MILQVFSPCSLQRLSMYIDFQISVLKNQDFDHLAPAQLKGYSLSSNVYVFPMHTISKKVYTEQYNKKLELFRLRYIMVYS